MRLGIDLDGVVADFNAGWMQVHAEEFGTELVPDMVDSWNCLHRLGGFADMGAFWAWASPNERRRSIFRHLQPYPDAVASLTRLAKQGHRVVIVTTKPTWARTDTFRWLADHDVPTSEVHLSDRKYEVDCDVYLDDAPHVLDELVEHRPTATICRFVRPWNEPVRGTQDVSSWAEFVDVVTQRSHRVADVRGAAESGRH
jgi:5'(3')-deoxyribonucleotidase